MSSEQSATREKPKPKTYDELLSEFFLQDAQKTFEEAKDLGRQVFPDPVQPQWKN